jgi:hypothetical protein
MTMPAIAPTFLAASAMSAISALPSSTWASISSLAASFVEPNWARRPGGSDGGSSGAGGGSGAGGRSEAGGVQADADGPGGRGQFAGVGASIGPGASGSVWPLGGGCTSRHRLVRWNPWLSSPADDTSGQRPTSSVTTSADRPPCLRGAPSARRPRRSRGAKNRTGSGLTARASTACSRAVAEFSRRPQFAAARRGHVGVGTTTCRIADVPSGPAAGRRGRVERGRAPRGSRARSRGWVGRVLRAPGSRHARRRRPPLARSGGPYGWRRQPRRYRSSAIPAASPDRRGSRDALDARQVHRPGAAFGQPAGSIAASAAARPPDEASQRSNSRNRSARSRSRAR